MCSDGAVAGSVHQSPRAGGPIIEKVVRSVLVYLFLIVLLRLIGRHELARINSGDFVVLLLLSNTVQNATIGNDNSLLGGLIGALALLGINGAVVGLLYRHPRLARWFEGRLIVLVRHGRLMRPEPRRLVLSEDEVQGAPRRQGTRRLANVEEATLDMHGNVVVTLKPAAPGDAAQVTAELARLREQVATLLQQQQTLLERTDHLSR
jgi:uncharacterized membrane protein YcaP (DUF421 family)